MSLFKIGNNDDLAVIREQPFRLEKEIQALTEKNLKSIFNLELVKSELCIHNFRIDTLAYDNEANSFVIIEYKKDKNFSVVDQGMAYLSLMLNNKADFILEYNENVEGIIRRGEVDWSQSKVMFVSPAFTTYQQEAINFKDLPIELWEVTRYDNDTIDYTRVLTSGAQDSIQNIGSKDERIQKVAKEVKVYTETEHLEAVPVETKELYGKFKEAILNMADLTVKPKKKYIAFVARKNVVDIHIQRNGIKIWVNLQKGELDDPKKLARGVSSIGHWGNGDYEIQVTDDENLEYVMSLVKQSLKKNTK